MTRRVAVIGGGISGLAAAYRLLQESPEPLELLLIEASGRLGGVIQTDRSQGVVLEGGPDSFLRRKPEALQLSEELGLGSEVIGTNPNVRGAYIFYNGRFHDIPEGVQAGVPARLEGLFKSELLNQPEKFRLMADLALPRLPFEEDMALGRLLRYRFGDAYVDRIAAPMMSGIYAGDIDLLSCAVTAPQLLRLQQRGRSLIQESQKEALRAPRPAPGPSGGIFSTLARGLGTLVEALESRIRSHAQVMLGSPVETVDRTEAGYRLVLANQESFEATDLIVAVPAYQAARILTFWDDAERALLSEIPYADLAVIGAVYQPTAFNRPLNKTGFLVPRNQVAEMTAGTWVRSKWNYPDTVDLVPVRAFYGRSGDRALLTKTDEEMLGQFRQDMGYIMGVTDVPQYQRVFRIPQGMPQYLVGHQRRAEAIQKAVQRWPGLRVIGSYFDGVGIPDCIRHANQAATELIRSWGS